jgi:hypothetical protein
VLYRPRHIAPYLELFHKQKRNRQHHSNASHQLKRNRSASFRHANLQLFHQKFDEALTLFGLWYCSRLVWNGFTGPVALPLPVFSCPALYPGLPPRYPINPSSSSASFLRPQIRHATSPRLARMIAPPIPTTTPMTVFFVCGLMEEEFVWLSVREAGLVDTVKEVEDEVASLV